MILELEYIYDLLFELHSILNIPNNEKQNVFE